MRCTMSVALVRPMTWHVVLRFAKGRDCFVTYAHPDGVNKDDAKLALRLTKGLLEEGGVRGLRASTRWRMRLSVDGVMNMTIASTGNWCGNSHFRRETIR